MSHASPTTDPERRRKPREAYVADGRIECPTARPKPRDLAADAVFCPHDSRRAVFVDRSRDGLRLVVTEPVPVGAYQRVHVDGDPAAERREARVVRCDPLGDGTFEVGAILC